MPALSGYRSDNFAKVLLRCSEADSAATTTLYHRYQPQLVRLARDLGADDPEGSADLAFFDGLRAIDNLHTRTELSFRSYLYTATRNRVVSERRKGAVDTTPLEWEPKRGHEAGVENEVVDSLFLETAMSDLTSDQRAVLVHRFFGGYSSAETARRLGKSSSAVRRLQHTGLKNLRRACVAAGLIALVVVAVFPWRGQAGRQRIDVVPPVEQPDQSVADRSGPARLPSTTSKPARESPESTRRPSSTAAADQPPARESQIPVVQEPASPAADRIAVPTNPVADTAPKTIPDSTVDVTAVPTTATTPTSRSTTTNATVASSVASPVATDDTIEVEADKDEKIKVLDNDSAVAGSLDEDTLEIVTPPRYVDTYRVHDDHIHYRSIDNFEGTDTLTYRICDTGNSCATATVTIVVTNN